MLSLLFRFSCHYPFITYPWRKKVKYLCLCLNAFNPTFQNSEATRPKTARTDANYALFLAEVERERLQHPSIPRMNSRKNPLPFSASTFLVMKKDLDHWGYAKLQVCMQNTLCNTYLLYHMYLILDHRIEKKWSNREVGIWRKCFGRYREQPIVTWGVRPKYGYDWPKFNCATRGSCWTDYGNFSFELHFFLLEL